MTTFTSLAASKLTGVTLLTGFLGAGKTTLLNRLLCQLGKKKRLAVIENEYGEVNVDAALVSDKLSSREDVMPMPGGCVCCSLRKDIVKALADLQQRGAAGGGYDGIFLETTGLADPAPVAFTFFSNPWIRRNFRLDSIVCVVDAKNLLLHLAGDSSENAVHEVVNQIAFADLILINKIDLVDKAQLQQVRGEVRAINATAELIETQLEGGEECEWMHRILDRNFFSVDRALEIDPDFLTFVDDDDEPPSEPQLPAPADAEAAGPPPQGSTSPRPVVDTPPASDSSATGRTSAPGDAAAGAVADAPGRAGGKRSASDAGLEDEARDVKREAPDAASVLVAHAAALTAVPRRVSKRLHDLSKVSSIGVTVHGEIDSYRFNMFMLDLVAARGRDIFRTKGVIHVHGFEKPFVIQGVHETFTMGPANLTRPSLPPGVQPANTIVFIGLNMDKTAIREGLRTCVWIPLPEGWSEHRDEKTKRTYYFNPTTGENSWVRPELLCPHVTTQEYGIAQPPDLRPPASVS